MDRNTGRNLRWAHLKNQETPWLTAWNRPGTVAGTLPSAAFGERDQGTCIWTTSLALSVPLCCFNRYEVSGRLDRPIRHVQSGRHDDSSSVPDRDGCLTFFAKDFRLRVSSSGRC
jgi:hypothetical protein